MAHRTHHIISVVLVELAQACRRSIDETDGPELHIEALMWVRSLLRWVGWVAFPAREIHSRRPARLNSRVLDHSGIVLRGPWAIFTSPSMVHINSWVFFTAQGVLRLCESNLRRGSTAFYLLYDKNWRLVTIDTVPQRCKLRLEFVRESLVFERTCASFCHEGCKLVLSRLALLSDLLVNLWCRLALWAFSTKDSTFVPCPDQLISPDHVTLLFL